jgi:hypothetical protein
MDRRVDEDAIVASHLGRIQAFTAAEQLLRRPGAMAVHSKG